MNDATARLSFPAIPQPAATLILLRDADHGPEVLMLKRHGLSDVLGGVFVFPGGKVDADDAHLDAVAHLDASPATLHERLGEPAIDIPTAAALYVAALREAFEESGVLLAHGEAPGTGATGMPFNALLAASGLRLAVDAIVPWSRWITPERSAQKRFDTRFFVARLPEHGVASHDGHETTEAAWLDPRAALRTYWDGGMKLAPPQIMTLAALARHGSVDAVLGAARGRRPPMVQPHILGDGASRVMCYPGDASHPLQQRAMPGPLRLLVRGERFEPREGFDAFFVD